MNPDVSVSKIMTTDLITIGPDVSLKEINEIFEKYGFHHIPVVTSGGLIGIISKQDFLQVSHALSYSWSGEVEDHDLFHNFTARDIMTEYPLHLTPDDSVGLAADIFLANKFHALPIMEDEDLVGLVTAHDIIAYAFSSPIVQKAAADE